MLTPQKSAMLPSRSKPCTGVIGDDVNSRGSFSILHLVGLISSPN